MVKLKLFFDSYASLCYIKRHSTVKLKVTSFAFSSDKESFAFAQGNAVKFKRLRNAVQR